ncbi:unnamed protein product, partial [Mesorhabditis spiculigera]
MDDAPGNQDRADLMNFSEIPVFELRKENFEKILPYLLVCIKEADLVALDLEMSGLGPHGTRSKDTEQRYAAFRESAATRGILSLGIATFKNTEADEEGKVLKYQSHVFNILTYPNTPFTIEPGAMEFLVRHGFDFNKVVGQGVMYHPQKFDKDCPLRRIFTTILLARKPVALHNGWLDMCFLYQQLYTPLPEKLKDFLAALSELFPPESALIDSKYLAEYTTRMKGSFLEYVFRRCQRDNVYEAFKNRACIEVHFPEVAKLMRAMRKSLETTNCALPQDFPDHVIPVDLKTHVCQQYVQHGFCRTKGCTKLHDVDFALDIETMAAMKGRKRRIKRYEHITSSVKTSVEDEDKAEVSVVSCTVILANAAPPAKRTATVAEVTERKPRIAVHGSHRAGVDAFMTGFSVLFQDRMSLLRTRKFNPENLSMFPLSGKPFPLKVLKENQAELPDDHVIRFKHIQKDRVALDEVPSNSMAMEE